MDSPTHFSESNLRKYSKGLRSSKKSLYAYSDYCEEKDGNTLGPRSISLTALHSEVKNGGLEPRMAQLETLEAKMASIEVSLSTTGRKRKNVPIVRTPKELAKELEVLRNALRDKENVIQSLKSQLNNSFQRVPGTYLKNGSSCLKPMSDNERRGVEERLQKVEKDMDGKRLAAKNLKFALERLDISDNIDVRIQQAELEYQLEREELNLLNLEEEARNLRNCMEESDACRQNTLVNTLFNSVPDKMNATLHALEVVFDPENPTFTVSKKEGKLGLFITWASEDIDLKKGDRLLEVNGHLLLSGGREDLSKILSLADLPPSSSLRLAVLRCQPFLPQRRELSALRDELALVSDRLEEERRQMREMAAERERMSKERETLRGENLRLTHRISYLEEQVAEMQRETERRGGGERVKSKEGGGGVTASIRRSKENGNQRQKEDSHTKAAAVFQKGSHCTRVPAEVAEVCLRSKSPENRHHYPTLRASPSSSCSSPTQNHHPQSHLRARLLETLRRVSPPGGSTSSARSVDSLPSVTASEPAYSPGTRASKNGSDSISSGIWGSKNGSDSGCSGSWRGSKNKPPPPRKPARLSLPRTTSVQSVDAECGSATMVLKRSYKGQLVPLRPWPSVEQSIGGGSVASTGSSGKSHRCWNSIINGLRPATSLGLAAAKGSEKWC